MPDEPDERPTQTTPTGAERERLDLPGEGGLEIPVPKLDEITKALAEVAKPDKSPDPPLRRRKRRSKKQ
jgi:hypothetical protein